MYGLPELQELLKRHAAQPSCETVIPGLKLMRSDTVSSCMIAAVHSPLICIMVQGAKHVLIGETALEYRTGDFLISSVDLPVSAWITDASPEKPYLALALRFDPQLLASAWLDLPNGVPTTGLHRAVAVSKCSPELLEPFVRLVRLLNSPNDIAHLSPLILREIYYRLLTCEYAGMLRHLALPQHQLPQVQKAINWIRHNYQSPCISQHLLVCLA